MAVEVPAPGGMIPAWADETAGSHTTRAKNKKEMTANLIFISCTTVRNYTPTSCLWPGTEMEVKLFTRRWQRGRLSPYSGIPNQERLNFRLIPSPILTVAATAFNI